ncbi:hypothetical protein F2Q70_00013391 [Brassica cretica]|uniref:RNase H type-1 domain-containing protein n=1 Tax=Brassica cretica TaxID=69181 RepID=A0A8S9LWI6_BRACR|nr:hypothetical protein F2Q70_00013391 [Brassica cretica]
MLTNPQAWPNFSTELEGIQILQMCFPAFKISYFPRAQNEIADSLARNARINQVVLAYWQMVPAGASAMAHGEAQTNPQGEVQPTDRPSLRAHGEAQTNPQGEVQPTDRPSLRVFKWALKHRPISVLGDQDNCDLVSRSRKGDVVLEVALRQKIYVNPSKLKLLECLGFSKDDMQWFTGKEEESHIHIFQTRSLEKLNEFVQQVSPEIIIPSVNFGHDSVAAMVFTLVT